MISRIGVKSNVLGLTLEEFGIESGGHVGSTGGFSSGVFNFGACNPDWGGFGSSGVSNTEWVELLPGGVPLSVLESIELGPKVVLSFSHTSNGSSFALVDWHLGGKSFLKVFVVPACFEEKDDDHDVEDTESDEDETEYLSTSESGDETSVDGAAAGEGNSGVGVDSDSHTNVTGKDGGH